MNFEFPLPLLLDLVLKSSAILLTAFGVAWLARNASAARRHLVWLAAFITLAILPLALTIPPRWSWSWQRPAPVGPAILTTFPAAMQEAPDSPAEAALVRPTVRLPGWAGIAAGVWLAGALLLLVRQAAGCWNLRGVRRRSSAITSGLATELAAAFGAVEMRQSPVCAVPFTWGWWRPVVVLPASASSWPERQLRAALAHEFGHIARSDFLWRQLAQVVRALFWPNPLVWLAVRALHRTQEQACDDLVLRRGASPRDYAMQLLEATRSLAGPVRISSQAVAMALPSALEARVRAIVDQHRDRRAPGHWSRLSAAAAVIVVIAGSAFAQVKSSPPEASAAPQTSHTHGFLLESSFASTPTMQTCSNCHSADATIHSSAPSPNPKPQPFQGALRRHGFLSESSHASVPATQACVKCHHPDGTAHHSQTSPRLEQWPSQAALTASATVSANSPSGTIFAQFVSASELYGTLKHQLGPVAASAVLAVDIRANALTLDTAHPDATKVRELVAKLDQRSPNIKVAANIKRMIPATSTSAAREEVLSRATILGGADRPMTLKFDDAAHGTITVELIVTPEPEMP